MLTLTASLPNPSTLSHTHTPYSLTRSKIQTARTLFVGNLPPSTKKTTLASLFKKFGDVSSARLRGMPSSSISSNSQSAADHRHALPPGRHGDINLQKKVVSIKSTVTKTDVTSIIGYVVFASPDTVSKVLAHPDPITLQSNVLNLDGVGPNALVFPPELTVFIGNLPYASSEDTLRTHVNSVLGPSSTSCTRVRLVRDSSTRRCCGTGYALLTSKESVASILRTGLGTYKKKELRAEVCGKRTKKKKRPTYKQKGVERAREGGGRRVLGKLKRGGALGDKEKSVHKRKNSVKVFNGAGAGVVSKRKEREKKVNDRVKKLNKRVEKGMGSQKASKKR